VSEHDRPQSDEEARSLWAGDDHIAKRPEGRPDPASRPPDPAGTKPLVDPESVVPQRAEGERGPLHAVASTPAAAPADAPASDAPSFGAPAFDAADAVAPEELEPAAAAAAGRAEPPHAPRFQFALGALIAVGIAAVAAVVAIAIGISNDSGSSATAGSTWSAWHPLEGAGDGPTQIAQHVSAEYRLPEGGQLVAVTGGPMEVAGLPLTVALREPMNQGGDIKLIDGKGVLFRMCGLGPKCSIDKGKPSTRRHLLLRREALELSLYAFHYLDGVENAVVFLPPRKGQDPTQALFFQKSDLAGALDHPLSATLTPSTPSVSSVAASPDAPLVNTITTRTLFQFSLTQANQDTRVFLVLDPLSGN
jgi:hypothetical protein